MSYLKKIKYEIVLKDALLVIRGCPKCGRKTQFKSTKKFRVNANGGRVDVWLIYQCEECKHTLNLAIYERQKVSSIPKKEYDDFMANEEQLAEAYGKNVHLFRKNKAEIDLEGLDYSLVKVHEIVENSDLGEQVIITIYNPCQLKIRPEKLAAQALGLSRSQIKSLMESGEVKLNKGPKSIQCERSRL